jgi:hypothetical protein
MSIVQQATGAWRAAAGTIAERPLPFVIAAALLTGTDLLQWKLGAFDGVPAAQADKGLLATFLIGKLVVTLGWILASLRLLDGRSAGLLKLGKRQLLWIGGLFLLLPLMLLFRVVLQRVAGAALAPLAPDPRTVLLVGILFYLGAVLYFQVRLIPALIGVLVGDEEAGLRWSWRGTRGLAGAFIAALLLTMLPLFALHFGNSLVWLPEAAAARFLVLAFDGATMAFLLLASCAAYLGHYRRTKAQADRTSTATGITAVHAA